MSELTATALQEAYTDGYLRGQKKAYDECDEVARELSQIKIGCSEWLDEHDKKIRTDAIDDFQEWLKTQIIGLDNKTKEVLVVREDRWELAIDEYKEQLKR